VISDEIWVRLDPGAGMVREIGFGRWFLAGIAALLVAAAWVSGAIGPRLSGEDGGIAHAYVTRDEIGRPRGAEAEIEWSVRNDGWLPVTITGIGVPDSDLYTLRTAKPGDGGLPRSIPPGGSMSLTLVLSAGDCPAMKEAAVPLVVEVDRWWGRTTADVATESGPDWFSSSCE